MSQLVAFVQVIFIDLVLAGEDAIVVGMATASVPIDQRRPVIILGTAAAVVLRIVFALVTTQLLQISTFLGRSWGGYVQASSD